MLLPSAHHQPTQSHGPKIRTRSQNPARPRPRWSPRATPGRREARRQPPAQGLSPPSARAHPVPAFRGTSVPHGPRAGEPTCVRRPAMEIGYLPCAGPVPPAAPCPAPLHPGPSSRQPKFQREKAAKALARSEMPPLNTYHSLISGRKRPRPQSKREERK